MRANLDIEAEVAAVGDLIRDELADRWLKIYGVPAPRGARRVFLERAIAWHIQAKAFGGIDKDAQRSLFKASATQSARVDTAEPDEASARGRSSRALPSAGARLIREWHGKTHVVDVVATGYIWEGKTYKSLSMIARAITGAHWSGPRFFGL
ncbi:DUF2924 domain-containing protein [Mesorhizobium sp. M2E.F.Ca.ET.209.01.1.1]|uniref:DUF2924 domain-containing protein n=1 Tax=Mesorhizobium sp. M2E.F.Ca.ET.209.01.1.1 TaxID=2500526 RepID=UPI000FDBFC7D|nr:DUF2924 domain-containing protein [Mesorhizobium sp. M2E.F.Ca.ET.209.01.1.1]TGS09818.1 DUF2924 domain-containing protein [Mesorhizobium sp. M2E.F.Ca.ET.209.01.1.1]